MTGRWDEVKLVFQAALAVDPSLRTDFLDETLPNQPDLRTEVDSLLKAHEESGDFLRTSPIGEYSSLGNYRLVRELARGGMGTVYLAERGDEQFHKQVAIKVLESVHSPEAVIRFVQERRILASLDHPNIARLLDGGTATGGSPYLVMEFVDGTPIDKFCEKEDLSIPERVRIFLKVCEAIHYAHQRLVIHRDIKPANILVTADHTPKLVDFGIAKLLDPNETFLRGVTRTICTPEYASPEQLRGEPLSTASDIFSLGATLYQVLTQAPSEPARRFESPSPPSAGCRSSHARWIKGDLDAIVLCALSIEPARRYPTVQHFAADLEAYLQSRPVSARRGGFPYAARKFLRRNWRSSAATAAMLAISLSAAAFAIRERTIAGERLRKVQLLANTMIVAADESISLSEARRRAYIQDTMRQIEAVARESRGDSDIIRAVGNSLARVGGLSQHLNDWNTALNSSLRALAILRSIPHPSANDQWNYLGIYAAVPHCQLRMGRSADALAASRELNTETSNFWRDRHTLEGALSVLRAAEVLGPSLIAAGETREAVRLARGTLDLPFDVLDTAQNQGEYFVIAHPYLEMADTLLQAGDQQTAQAIYRRVERFTTRFENHPQITQLARAEVHAIRARLHNAFGNPTAALESRRRELVLLQAQVTTDPTSKHAQRKLAESHLAIGTLLARLGQSGEAETHLRIAGQILSFYTAEDAPDIEWPRQRAVALEELASLQAASGHAAASRDTLREALHIWAVLARRDPFNRPFAQKESALAARLELQPEAAAPATAAR
jgi:serine/threonine protein kinase